MPLNKETKSNQRDLSYGDVAVGIVCLRETAYCS